MCRKRREAETLTHSLVAHSLHKGAPSSAGLCHGYQSQSAQNSSFLPRTLRKCWPTKKAQLTQRRGWGGGCNFLDQLQVKRWETDEDLGPVEILLIHILYACMHVCSLNMCMHMCVCVCVRVHACGYCGCCFRVSH